MSEEYTPVRCFEALVVRRSKAFVADNISSVRGGGRGGRGRGMEEDFVQTMRWMRSKVCFYLPVRRSLSGINDL